MDLRRGIRAIAAGAGALALAACSTSSSSFRETVGLDQRPPDEFMVVSKAPLVVPPNMNLRPPAPGAPPLGEADPRALAQSAVTGGGAPGAGTASAGEQAILARAGTADPAIRDELRRDQAGTADQTVLEQVRTARRDQAETLEPYSESDRLRTVYRGQTPGQTATTGAPATGAPTTIVLEDILGGPPATN